MTELQNASQLPRVFYARHMQPGVCKYEDEVVLVDTNAMKSMIGTGTARPVYVNHQNVDLKNLKEEAAGYITESFYNELDGWAWFKFIAIDDEIHNAIGKGWKVSNAYKPAQFGNGGTKNNCPYDREILNAEFTHLAIVPNPRYEDACIMTPEEFKNYQDENKRRLAELQNSKPDLKGKTMLKIFKNKKEEVTTVDLDTMVEISEGKELSVREMLNAVKENDKREAELANADQMVECDGEKMPLKELVNKYNALKKSSKKNDDDDDMENEDEDADEAEEAAENKKNKKTKKNKKEKKNNDGEDDAGENQNSKETDAEKAARLEEEKTNDKHFEELKNAHEKAQKTAPTVEAPHNRSERGKQRYGSSAK